jgi:hypothetical protein
VTQYEYSDTKKLIYTTTERQTREEQNENNYRDLKKLNILEGKVIKKRKTAMEIF